MNAAPIHLESERQAFRQQIQARVAQGQWDEALRFCDDTLKRAGSLGDPDFVDQVITSRANLLINRGEGAQVVAELRRLLMRSADPANRFSASYAISYHYDLCAQPDKGLFYAKQSLRSAEEWGDLEAQSRAHNLLGNLYALDSLFAEAVAEYQRALEFQAPGDSVDRSIQLSNLGYCRVVTGIMSHGYRDLTSSLRMMRRLGSRTWLHLPLMGLSFACLEVGRPARARRYATDALESSERVENPDSIKNSLFLLGESEKQCGNSSSAYERFVALQRRFYPDNPMVVDILMATDVRRMINLMA